jgi:hypothetical protein
MLLRRPWLRDARVAHDWGNNTMTIQGNGIVKTITRSIGEETKSVVMLQLLEWYIDEANIIFAIEP